ncbi:phosphatase PAP2 family protein [Streptomyces violaceusniger]|uniref:Phosphoesterase PA-phosphatase related protein n=1 Tax=Streptomyces violaceusniger (strain Tu 4113) TaxID=653045 RepID=G2P2P6_STRV4|nr:phosphatase PAP2 family protein [Streptomyces violaceusniger]AEM82169.1 phosphoesterase PA-phosphatase related protein [Streptomyces violaceusniger Tu 4113]
MPHVRHWPRLSVLLFLAAIALGLVAAHTSLIQPHDLAADRTIQTDTRTGWLNSVMLGVSYVASPVGGLVMLALWCGWLLFVRHRPVSAVSTFLVVAVGWNASEIGKLVVARNRPPAVYSLDPEIGSNSFPSGHVAFTVSAVTAAYFLARGSHRQRPVGVAAVVIVAVIAFSRLYIGAHYPTDVLGSVLISGAAILCLTGLWHAWLLPRLHLVPYLALFGPVPGPAVVAGGERHVEPVA